MNADKILETFNKFQVDYLLIGGVNFMLRHEAILTFDIDLWIDDTEENLRRCSAALAALDAEWGQTDADWGLVAAKPPGWLSRQGVYSLHSPHGAIDIFRYVTGLADWQSSFATAKAEATSGGVAYHGISDEDMLRCQLALDAGAQKASRIKRLEQELKKAP